MKKFTFFYKTEYFQSFRKDVMEKHHRLSIFKHNAQGIEVPKNSKPHVSEVYEAPNVEIGEFEYKSKFIDVVAKNLDSAVQLLNKQFNSYRTRTFEFTLGSENTFWRLKDEDLVKKIRNYEVIRFLIQGIVPISLDHDMITIEGGTFDYVAPTERSGEYYDRSKMNPQMRTVMPFKMKAHLLTVNEMCDIVRINDSHRQQTGILMDSYVLNLYEDVTTSAPAIVNSLQKVMGIIEVLNIRSKKKYRLPTPVEWQFAARSGVLNCPTLWAGSNDPDETCVHQDTPILPNGSFLDQAMLKKPNKLGLYNICGMPQICMREDAVTRRLETGSYDYYKGFTICGGAYRKNAAKNTVYSQIDATSNYGFCIRLVEDI